MEMGLEKISLALLDHVISIQVPSLLKILFTYIVVLLQTAYHFHNINDDVKSTY